MKKILGLSLVVVLAAPLQTGSANAVPWPGVSNSVGNTPRDRAGLSCDAAVVGFDHVSHVVIRAVHNGTVSYAKTSPRGQKFKVLASAYAGGEKVGRNGFDMNVATINGDSRPRYLYVVDPDRTTDQELETQPKPFERKLGGQRLLAGAHSYYWYLLNKHGVLNRWATYEGQSGAYYWANPERVRAGLGSLKTMVWGGTMRVRGHQADILWGTTRRGALVQIQVPTENIGRSRYTTVKKSGFDGVSGMSPSSCNGKPSFAMLVTVNAGKDEARWYTLRDQANPQRRNLDYRGKVGDELDGVDLSWKLHAVH